VAITPESAASSLTYAQEHIFQRILVCQDHDVLTEAFRHGRGRIGHMQLKACLGRP